ncbi:integrase, catalytic region, zinc finger, CCHC-type containing protein [Tanacetum coccineum]
MLRGTSEHDSNAHDEYHEIQMLAYNVQREAKNQKRLNNELKKQKELLQKELEMCKDRVKTFKSKTIQCSKYKETCEELERELQADKDTVKRILKEKDKIQSDFFKIENEKLIIQHETQLAKKAFKERENWYLEDIVDLEEKLSSHDRIVYKIGQSIQTIHRLGKKPNKVYDPFLKAGLGYKNPKRLKKAIAAQPKMYDGERLHSAKLTIDSPDSEETLEDAEESRLKIRNKMVQINYGKLNELYETFVPQQEFSVEQTYFSIPFTFNNGSESKEVTSDLPIAKMPIESKLLKMFDTMGVAINGLRTRIDKTLLEDRQRRCMSDSQNSLREFYKIDVIPMSASLSNNLKELKEELIEEIDRLLEVSLTSEIRNYVLISVEKHKNELLKAELEKSSSDSKDIQANLLKRIKILENDFKRSQAQSVEISNSVRRPKYKDTKSKDRVLKNNNDKRPSAHVRKMSSSVSIDSNKRETMHLNVIQLVLWIVDSGCSKHMTGNLQLLRNFIEKFMGTVRFGNDHFAAITGFGDYVQCNLTICHVYYVQGLEGDDLLTGSRDSNLYTISISEMATSSPMFLMSKATSTKSWLWHHRLSHLNFEYYATSSPEVTDNSAANTLDNEHTSSSSSIIVEEDEAPQIVSSSAAQVATEPNVSLE